jgi:hypothetical protein
VLARCEGSVVSQEGGVAVFIDYEKYPQARIFETHGVEFTDSRGDELIGTCPFTGKAKKFYVNRETWLWDSKTAGMSGNIPKFLEEVTEEYRGNLEEEQVDRLSRNRKIPMSAFKVWDLGWDGTHYTIPVRNLDGKIVDIRMYDVRKKNMRSTAGCHVGLLGAHQLKERLHEPIYICEGEWDAMALRWLLRKVKAPGLVVAVPGAGIFKKDWVRWFSGKKVYALYDHDEPGRKGEQMLHQRLGSVAKSMTFTHWPDELPSGFDVRDWIIYGIRKGTLDLCFERLHKLFKKMPRRSGGIQRTQDGKVIRLVAKAEVVRERPDEVPTLEDVHTVYRKWLHLPSTDAIDVMLSTVISQTMDGPPVWMFLVSPPGGAKTITLAGLTEYENAYSTSSLTAKALISGSNERGAADPSLIPRLHGKVLVIKDFTSILNMRENEKEEIFGILRDAYDGRCGKVFGNGVERTYESHFTIIAAVTPSIYEVGSRHAALGERFLKFVMGDNLHHYQEQDIISKAIENVDQDTQIREELTAVTSLFLAYGFEDTKPPKLDSVLHKRIIRLAQLGARLRGTVSRDRYHSDDMTGRPFAEVGSRLGIQLAKIARALAMVRNKRIVGQSEYNIVKKIMLDTVSQRSEDVVRALWLANKEMTVKDLVHVTRYPQSTVRRLMEDLNLLKVIQRKGASGSGFQHTWTLTDYVRTAIIDSQIYDGVTGPRLVLRPGRAGRREPGRAEPPKTAQNP